jgi:hypothetical protein
MWVFGSPCAALSVKANVCALGMSWDLCSGACPRSHCDYARAAGSPLPPGIDWTSEWHNSGVSGLELLMCHVERKSERVCTWDKLGLCSGVVSPASFWLSGGALPGYRLCFGMGYRYSVCIHPP